MLPGCFYSIPFTVFVLLCSDKFSLIKYLVFLLLEVIKKKKKPFWGPDILLGMGPKISNQLIQNDSQSQPYCVAWEKDRERRKPLLQ